MVRDFSEGFRTELTGSIVTNPPYGLRLEDFDLDRLYDDILTVFHNNPNLSGGLITSYDFGRIARSNEWKNRKLYNGNELCYFYTKKPPA